MPIQSNSSTTTLLDELSHPVQVSTWPRRAPSRAVPAMVLFTCLMYLTSTSGSTPGLDPAAMPCGELRYKSSLPIEIPSTILAKLVPYCLMAASRARISLAKAASPADAQRPSSSEVLVLMAAGMAEMGSLAVPPCYLLLG